LLNRSGCILHDFFIFRQSFTIRVEKIGQQAKKQSGLGVAQEMHFKLANQIIDFSVTGQHSRDNHQGLKRSGYLVSELKFWQDAWFQQVTSQLTRLVETVSMGTSSITPAIPKSFGGGLVANKAGKRPQRDQTG
jgi:hypothetical protein